MGSSFLPRLPTESTKLLFRSNRNGTAQYDTLYMGWRFRYLILITRNFARKRKAICLLQDGCKGG